MKIIVPRNGIPTMVDVAFGIAYDKYETLTIDKVLFTLPNGQVYTPGQQELEVYVDGVAQTLGLDYSETNTTQITFAKTVKAGSTIRVRR